MCGPVTVYQRGLFVVCNYACVREVRCVGVYVRVREVLRVGVRAMGALKVSFRVRVCECRWCMRVSAGGGGIYASTVCLCVCAGVDGVCVWYPCVRVCVRECSCVCARMFACVSIFEGVGGCDDSQSVGSQKL
jgi:hypothetical protein